MDRKSLARPKSLPHWSGHQKDLAHYIHATMQTHEPNGSAAVVEVLEYVLQHDVIKTPIKVKNPDDRRTFIEPAATVFVMHVHNGHSKLTLGV